MTCTHAAMTRRRLIELGFKYDRCSTYSVVVVVDAEQIIEQYRMPNHDLFLLSILLSIIMEESAQILEVESLIPMLLQDCDPVDRRSRLKRVVLLVKRIN